MPHHQPILHIESRQNPRVREWVKLQSPKGRRLAGLFIAESEHLVDEAVLSGIEITDLLVREGTRPLRCGSGTRVYEVSESVMAAVCEAKSPPGVAAICRIPAPPEKVPAGGPILLLDGVQDPGNVGALIRTADAAGAVAVVIGGGSADPWGAKAVRSSEGSVFHLAVMEGRDLETRVRELKQDGIPVLATALDRGTWVSQADSRQCFALIVGSEARGVSDKLICLADAVLRIPMRGKAESLNVAVAAGIALFHVTGLTRPG